jgi:putative transposase
VHRYERSADRVDTPAGHSERKLETKAAEVQLKVPKLSPARRDGDHRERPPERETSVEEVLVKMYFPRVSVRRVADITEAQWGTRARSRDTTRSFIGTLSVAIARSTAFFRL